MGTTKKNNMLAAIAAGTLVAGAGFTANAGSIFEAENLGTGLEIRSNAETLEFIDGDAANRTIEMKCGEKKGKDAKSEEKGKDAKCGEKGKGAKSGEKGKDAKCGEKGKDHKCGEKGKDHKCGEKGKDAKCGEKGKEKSCGSK